MYAKFIGITVSAVLIAACSSAEDPAASDTAQTSSEEALVASTHCRTNSDGNYTGSCIGTTGGSIGAGQCRQGTDTYHCPPGTPATTIIGYVPPPGCGLLLTGRHIRVADDGWCNPF